METLNEKINSLWKEGKTYKEIEKELNITRDCVAYHLTKKGRMANERKKAKLIADEKFLQKVIEVLPECNSINEVCKYLNLKYVNGYYKKVKKTIIDNNLDISHFGTLEKTVIHPSFKRVSNEEYFKNNTSHNGTSILKRLLNLGRERKCENPECGLKKWHDNDIPLQVHHINGNHFDNRLENLQILCPNCHALTDTYGNSKIHREKSKEEKNNKILVSNISNNILEQKKEEIEKEDLLRLFKRYKSFVKVGKILGISDNGVRKRCKKLGILEDILLMKKN